MARFLSMNYKLVAALGLLLAWYALALAAPQDVSAPTEPAQFVQTQTIAACGQSRCDCGADSLISEQSAPCQVQASTGECRTGSGWCCVCEARRTVAICADALCDCSNSTLLASISAPCTVTSSVGTCRIGSGSCCICGLD
jgi:hypothetical protein